MKRGLNSKGSISGERKGSAGATEPADSVPPRPVVRGSDGRFQPGSGRPPARRVGGQPGNLNSAANPWAVYWKRRALKPADRWALALVADYVPQLLTDKGGEGAVSFAERKVMELAAVARVCWALAMAAGNLDVVSRFVGAERQALTDLGLQRRAKPVPTATEIMRDARAGAERRSRASVRRGPQPVAIAADAVAEDSAR